MVFWFYNWELLGVLNKHRSIVEYCTLPAWCFLFYGVGWLSYSHLLTVQYLIGEYHDGCLIWSRICLPFRSTWDHSQFLVGFVLLSLQFLCSVLFTIICLFLAIILSVYFRSMSVNVPLVSFVPLLHKKDLFVLLTNFTVVTQIQLKKFGIDWSLNDLLCVRCFELTCEYVYPFVYSASIFYNTSEGTTFMYGLNKCQRYIIKPFELIRVKQHLDLT